MSEGAASSQPDPTTEVIYLGLGTNLGDREAHLARAAGLVAAIPGVELERCSAVYDSAPIGPEQPRYMNAVIALRSQLSPAELLTALKGVERKLGRETRERWAPRIIDLDVLLWGARVVAEPGLQIPHLALHERAFALAPLCELAPEARHPILEQTMQELLAQLPDQDVRRLATFPGGW